MRYILLLLPVLLTSAQKMDIDDAIKWVTSVVNPSSLDDKEGLKKGTIDSRFSLDPSKTSSMSCTTKDGKEGKCVKPLHCVSEPEQKDSTTLFIYREAGCQKYYLQCCALNEVKEKAKKPRTIPKECGWSNPGGYSLRTSDAQTGFSDFGDFPWMVALLKQSHDVAWNMDDYIGGGTLIHPSVVLTVAHKVEGREESELKCRAGEWDTKITDEILPHQDRNVKKIVVHDEFLQLRAHYDAALLFLESPFELKDAYHIGVACLGRNMPPPGSLCYSMGWGSSFNNNNNASLLKKIQLPLVDPNTCQRQLRNTRLGSNFLLHHSLTCAGGEEGKDTCVGDGGSSLVCPLQNQGSMTRYAVYGMVAYGVGCGVKDEPGVYAKVPSMIDWISKKIDEEKLTISTI